jgi:hypothetical protein
VLGHIRSLPPPPPPPAPSHSLAALSCACLCLCLLNPLSPCTCSKRVGRPPVGHSAARRRHVKQRVLAAQCGRHETASYHVADALARIKLCAILQQPALVAASDAREHCTLYLPARFLARRLPVGTPDGCDSESAECLQRSFGGVDRATK